MDADEGGLGVMDMSGSCVAQAGGAGVAETQGADVNGTEEPTRPRVQPSSLASTSAMGPAGCAEELANASNLAGGASSANAGSISNAASGSNAGQDVAARASLTDVPATAAATGAAAAPDFLPGLVGMQRVPSLGNPRSPGPRIPIWPPFMGQLDPALEYYGVLSAPEPGSSYSYSLPHNPFLISFISSPFHLLHFRPLHVYSTRHPFSHPLSLRTSGYLFRVLRAPVY